MNPRIVYLDAYPANPGDIDYTPLQAVGQLETFDRTSINDILRVASGAPIVLTNKCQLQAPTLEKLAAAGLKYIGVTATGTNIVDLPAARKFGVTVTNVPGYSTPSVAQLVFALLLEHANHTSRHARAVSDGGWSRSPDFCFTVGPITELSGKTFGVVGMGTIGKQVAQIASALGMKIAASHQRSMATTKIPGIDITWLSVDELFATADVISLHCPLTDSTRQMVNADRLSKMKRSAFLINTGRGPLIDEPALANALKQKQIAGAGLDVLSAEPPKADNPLLSAPNCIITPHVAWASVEARKRLLQMTADNIKAYLAGTPTNVVN